jgi:hypothetical protein
MAISPEMAISPQMAMRIVLLGSRRSSTKLWPSASCNQLDESCGGGDARELTAHLNAKYSDVMAGIRDQKIKTSKKDGQPYCEELEKALKEFAETFSEQ